MSITSIALWSVKPDVKTQLASTPADTEVASEDKGSMKQESSIFLTDEEMLSQFGDQPVALIGEPGNQRLVLIKDLD